MGGFLPRAPVDVGEESDVPRLATLQYVLCGCPEGARVQASSESECGADDIGRPRRPDVLDEPDRLLTARQGSPRWSASGGGTAISDPVAIPTTGVNDASQCGHRRLLEELAQRHLDPELSAELRDHAYRA